MKKFLILSKKIYFHFMKDSLYRNSIYLMISTFVMGGFGFFFWLINAHLFTPEQIGIASTLISAVTLLSNFNYLGLNIGIIKYLPDKKNINEKINTVLSMVFITSLISSLIYVFGINIFSPHLIFIKSNLIYLLLFILIVSTTSLNAIVDNIFISFKSTILVLLRNIIISISKIVVSILLVYLAGFGIFISVGFGTTIALLMGLIFLIKKYKFKPKFTVKINILKEIGAFSFGNYLVNFISNIPTNILPMIIISNLGAKSVAFYYIPMMMANLLYVIPQSVAQNLLAEGVTHGKITTFYILKCLKIILILLIPTILLIIFCGGFILNIFGKTYSQNGLVFLNILAISSIFMSINNIGTTILNIVNKIKTLIIINIINTGAIILLSILFIDKGLIGIGLAWLIGNAIAALLYCYFIYKNITT